MKIGYIAGTFAETGGVPLYAQGVIEAMHALPNVSVVVLAGNRGHSFASDIEVHPVFPNEISFHPKYQVMVFYRILRHLRNCDVLHAVYEKPMLGAALASRLLRIPLVLTVHGTYAIPPSDSSITARVKRRLMRFAYKTAAITTTGSFKTEERIRAIVSELPECRFIPNGFDSKVFNYNADTIPAERILSVGWLKPRKGFDIVIDALALLKDAFPNLTYRIIAGENDTPKLEYYKQLERQIQKLGLEARVQIHTGPISRSELAQQYRECAVFALTSRDSHGHFEGFPLVYMEAFACGAPIVTTRGYGSNYAIQDDVNGYLVGQDNPREVADAISRVLTSPTKHAEMRRQALLQAAKHSWTVIAPQLMLLYSDAVNQPRVWKSHS